MKIFGTIDAKNYTVEELPVTAPISWQLQSGSTGVTVIDPDFLEDAVSIQRASNTPLEFYGNPTPPINQDSGVYEYTWYRSIKHLFYDNKLFISGSGMQTASLAGLPDECYVVSVGQQFYGDRIKPGTFEVATEIAGKSILDDSHGNLYVNESGNVTYIGNVFYDKGVAIIKHDTGSAVTAVSTNGLKIVGNTQIYVDYESDVKLYRHEVAVELAPQDFNFSMFNPSIKQLYQASGSVSASLLNEQLQQAGVQPVDNTTDVYNVYRLMNNGIIKPYVTTIGLYNTEYQLLAVAKLSEPIQRTFNTNQTFIVRFDT